MDRWLSGSSLRKPIEGHPLHTRCGFLESVEQGEDSALGTDRFLGSPDALLHVEGRNRDGLVVDFGGVLIEGSCSLCAEVAVAQVEFQRGDAVRTVGAGKLHASGDAFCGVVSHSHDCSGGGAN